MALWTSSELADAVGGKASAEFAVDGVAFDSREIGDGDLFFALKGEQSDGHLYLDSVFKAGGAGAIVSQPSDEPHVLVEDTTRALNRTCHRIAQTHKRQNYRRHRIGWKNRHQGSTLRSARSMFVRQGAPVGQKLQQSRWRATEPVTHASG